MPEEQAQPEYRYTERLWPGPTVWVLSVGTVAALAIAYASALGPAAGWAVAALGALVALALIARWAVPIHVADRQLHAGRAAIEWEFTGQVLALDADQARTARGPDGDPTAFLVLSPGVGTGAVVVEVRDPQDPHRTWLLATRHPRRLACAIEGARGRVSP